MLHQHFKEIQSERNVKSKDLAASIGMSEKHFSQFLKGSANITIERFWELLLALDRASPGAKRDFCLRLSGLASQENQVDWDSLIANADLKELGLISRTVGKNLNRLSKKYEAK